MTSSVGYSIDGSGTPVVLLHSSMSSKAQWSRLIDQLKSNYQVIAIDLQGYGQTAFPQTPQAYSLKEEVQLINSILDSAIGNSKPFHLIGHSYGGAVGLRFAHEQASRVISLALYEPVAFYLLENDDAGYREISTVVDKIDHALASDPEAATQTFIDYWNMPGTFQTFSENIRASLIGQINKVRLDFQALMNEPLRLKNFNDLHIPVCLIAGQRSPASTRRIVELLSQTLPHYTRHEVSGGHMAPITHANEVNNILAAFLNKKTDVTIAEAA